MRSGGDAGSEKQQNKKGVRTDVPPNRPVTGYFFSGRAIVSRIVVSAMMFFIL